MRDLVLVKFNARLQHKRENKNRDPIEKVTNDILEDEDNEFITGIVPDDNAGEHLGNEAQAQQETSTSQAQGRKRKRPAVANKKRKKSIHSLLNSIEEDPMLCSSSSESEDDQARDESNYASADSD